MIKKIDAGMLKKMFLGAAASLENTEHLLTELHFLNTVMIIESSLSAPANM